MEGRLGRFIDKLRGKKPAPSSDLVDLTPIPSNIDRVMSKTPLSTRLMFGQRVPLEEIDINELSRLVERDDTPLIAQTTLPWNGTPSAEIYSARTVNVKGVPGLNGFRERRQAEELKLKEFTEGQNPNQQLTFRIGLPKG